MIVVAILGLTFSAVTLAAFAGRWVWWLDLLANFRVQYVVALTVFGAVLMAGRWRRSGTIVLLAMAINLVPVLPLFVGSPGEPVFAAPQVRVMTFNLLSNNQSFAEVFAYIRSIDPDLVLLQEASNPWEVAAEAANLGYQVIVTRAESLIFGTLILVRGDDVVSVSHGFAVGQPRAAEVTFRPPGWSVPLKVMSTHPVNPSDSERAALRDEQLRFAAQWAALQEGPHIVAGDLNATPWSWPFRNMLATTDLRNSQVGFGHQPTFSVDSNPLIRIPIDHLLHSPDLGVNSRDLGPNLGSDHFPVIVDLELRR